MVCGRKIQLLKLGKLFFLYLNYVQTWRWCETLRLCLTNTSLYSTSKKLRSIQTPIIKLYFIITPWLAVQIGTHQSKLTHKLFPELSVYNSVNTRHIYLMKCLHRNRKAWFPLQFQDLCPQNSDIRLKYRIGSISIIIELNWLNITHFM